MANERFGVVSTLYAAVCVVAQDRAGLKRLLLRPERSMAARYL
ncbi:MAG: hypothetical protein WBM40_24455 [Thiohalocapsa sp.]